MDLTILRNELATDPLGRGYAGMNEAEKIASLNAVNRTRLRPLDSRELLAWSGAGGRYDKIASACVNTGLPGTVRSIARAAERLICREDTSLDLNDAGRVAMVDALVATRILDAGDKASLVAMATQAVSRAAELGYTEVGIGWLRTLER